MPRETALVVPSAYRRARSSSVAVNASTVPSARRCRGVPIGIVRLVDRLTHSIGCGW
jgi:hypothetical protein